MADALHRNMDHLFPTGWSAVKDQFNGGLCFYTTGKKRSCGGSGAGGMKITCTHSGSDYFHCEDGVIGSMTYAPITVARNSLTESQLIAQQVDRSNKGYTTDATGKKFMCGKVQSKPFCTPQVHMWAFMAECLSNHASKNVAGKSSGLC